MNKESLRNNRKFKSKETKNKLNRILNNKYVFNKTKLEYKIYLFIVTFELLYQISFASKNEINSKRKLVSLNYINMTINGEGNIKILSIKSGHPENIPSEILYNNKSINYIVNDIHAGDISNEIYLDFYDNEKIKNLTLKWNNTIYDMGYMFYNCNSIISLDFSNFDTSFVTNMEHLFYFCSSLLSLEISSFNTKSVVNMSSMFCGCESLQYLNLDNFNTYLVEDMSYMFSATVSLKSLDLKSFNTTSVKNMRCMFCLFEFKTFILEFLDVDAMSSYYLSNLYNFRNSLDTWESLDLSNFDTSSVSDMSNMFGGCYSLKSLNLKKFNTSKVEDMNSMFSFCISLKSLNIKNFDTSYVVDMSNMFYGCNSLISIDLSGFDTSSVTSMEYMFTECISLISLDLSNFNSSSLESFIYIFYNCINLEYLNIINFNKIILNENFNTYYLYILANTTENIVYCINTTNISNPNSNIFILQLSSKKCSVNYCSKDWKTKQKKIVKILNTEFCVDHCSEINFYEYNKKCYSICPNGTSPGDNSLLCLNNSNININSSINYTSISYQDDINLIIYKIKNNEMNSIISDIINKNKSDYIIKNNDMTIQLTSISNQNNILNNNLSTIIINQECEKILKNEYGIKENETILLLKYDLYIEGLNIPIIGYELFNPNDKTHLDLKYCEKIGVNLNIPVTINESDLYKYNPESDYYKDICKSYDNNKNYDIIISDRQKEYNNYNLSLCPKNCTFNEYDYKAKKVSCQCEVQTELSHLLLEDIIDKDKLLNNFVNFKSISNINIIKCFKEVFSKNGLKKNIGSYIILVILFLFILLCILFYLKEYNLFFLKIDKDLTDLKSKNLGNENNLEENKKEEKKISKNNPIKKRNSNKAESKIESDKFQIISDNIISSNKSSVSGTGIDNSKSKNILVNINNVGNNDYIYLTSEINSFSYKKALKLDKRNFWQYYISLIKIKHLIIFTFFPVKDYNSSYIKICLFVFNFALFYFVNTLFFTDSTIHKIYEDEGIFNFIYLLPKIIYSSIISSLINSIGRKLALSESNIINFKNEEKPIEKEKFEKLKKCLKIKFLTFFIIYFILINFFWYYITCFGYVYKNTQLHLLKDTLISFSLSIIYPLITCLLPTIFRIISLHKPEYIYKFSKFLLLII